MVRNPVARDVDAAANPHAVVLKHIIEKFCKSLGAARASDESVVQRKRHHPRLALAFAVKHVEGILHVGEEVLSGCEARLPSNRLSLVS